MQQRNERGQFISGPEFTPEFRQALSRSRIGMKFSDEHKKNLSLAHKGRKHTEEQKRRISEGNLLAWRLNPNRPERNEKIRQRRIEILRAGKIPKTNTLPHRMLSNGMKQWGLWTGFKNERVYALGSIDIANENEKIGIFVDGDYWHGPLRPKQQEKDCRQTDHLKRNGWEVLRFWEDEIKKQLNVCLAQIAITRAVKGFCGAY